ncbi:MAG TPA: S8 family serine peptidase [Actinomycetota bacterium]|nr:S8 family serine peptidase [Actinomycetota bacterium]
MLKKALLIAMLPALVGAAPAASDDAGGPDPLISQQWGLARIRAQEAWATATGDGVTIAVVDSGVDLTHPDLAANVDTDHDADFAEGKGDTDGAQDASGHGTHVAGIAAAVTNNGVGVAGTAPKATILPVRVLGNPDGDRTSRIAAGIRYSADRGADVINLSLAYSPPGHIDSITGSMRPVHEAIAYALNKGAVVVASSGNDSLPFCAEPAAVDGVLCVGAVDRSERPAYYTNFESRRTKRYLVAPGGDQTLSCSNDILSTYLRGAERVCSSVDGYEADAGTSMAAGFVSGTAALLAEKGLKNTAIVECLLGTTDDLGPPGRDPVYGYGRLNAYRAVTGC